MAKTYKVTYSVTFEATISDEDNMDFDDLMSEIDIPEGGMHNSEYQEDSFELIEVETIVTEEAHG